MENKRLEELFRNKLDGLEIEPSKAIRDVFNQKIQLLKQKYLIRKISVAASILLVALAGTYAFLTNNNEKNEVHAQQELLMIDHGDDLAEIENFHSPDINVNKENTAVEEELLREKMSITTSEDKTDNIGPDNTDQEQLAFYEEASSPEVALLISEHQEQDANKTIADQVEENVYIEYYIEEPDARDQVMEPKHEPINITIEYIASGDKKEESQSKLKDFYSKMDNIKGVDEVFGDLRSYKDRLFALDFKNDKKVNNEE